MKILLTGGAGFIGSHVAEALLKRGDNVVLVDNMNDYYDITLKESRIQDLLHYDTAVFVKADIADETAMETLFKEHQFDKVCHLAAQAGVRYSIEQPLLYDRTNGKGTLVLFECCRKHAVKDIVFASSSSVYGGSDQLPFKEDDPVDMPLAMYAVTKRYNELQAYAYHKLYGLNCTGLRFFTVYGPKGRPDMALFKFTKAILENKPIEVYNDGKMLRDFTFISDIVSGVVGAIDKPFPYEIINLARGEQVQLLAFIEAIEKALGKKAEKQLLPMQQGDVPATHGDITKAQKLLGYDPRVSIEEGVAAFVAWYTEYYKVK